MSRRRFIHSETGQDPVLASLVNDHGPGIGLFYILLIPSAEDDAIVYNASPMGLKLSVVPGFDCINDADIEDMLIILHNNDLIFWDQKKELIYFHPSKFYKHQSNVTMDRRRNEKDHPTRKGVLKRTNRVVSSDLYEKWQTIKSLLPPHSSYTEIQIKHALKTYENLTLYDVRASMLGVLEKFGPQHPQLGTYFSNALMWKDEAEQNTLEKESNALEPGAFIKQYKELQTLSEQSLDDFAQKLDMELQNE